MRINKCHICDNDFDNLEAHFNASHIIEMNTEELHSEDESTNEQDNEQNVKGEDFKSSEKVVQKAKGGLVCSDSMVETETGNQDSKLGIEANHEPDHESGHEPDHKPNHEHEPEILKNHEQMHEPNIEPKLEPKFEPKLEIFLEKFNSQKCGFVVKKIVKSIFFALCAKTLH